MDKFVYIKKSSSVSSQAQGGKIEKGKQRSTSRFNPYDGTETRDKKYDFIQRRKDNAEKYINCYSL